MPTKTEQADLMLAQYGRHGEAPMPVIAIATPSDAFATTMEAVRIAVKYMTPVHLMSDGYIANSSEPWRLPSVESLPEFPTEFATELNGDNGEYLPYKRDEVTLARPWALPGTPGFEHRIGGLEHADLTGNVSYDPANHERMTMLREEKIARIAADIPPTEVYGAEDADLLLVGWGSTFGAIRAGVNRIMQQGHKAAHVHLRYITPFPNDLGDILRRYPQVLVPELNRGQLTRLLRAEYLIDARPFPKIKGSPFLAQEIEEKILSIVAAKDNS
jgi:2-oxoglutarate ferredoxin oxidoreductase subunit alpha